MTPRRLFILAAFAIGPALILDGQPAAGRRPRDSRCDGTFPYLNAQVCVTSGQDPDLPWSGYGHDPQHSGVSPTAAQSLHAQHWQTPVDENPPGGGAGELFAHYGSPLITAANTVIVPVATESGVYELRAFNGATGARLYTLPSDYTPPPHSWVPPYGPVLAAGTRIYYPGAGGTLYYRDLPNSPSGPNSKSGATGQLAFYGMTAPDGYTLNQTVYNATVHISTPLTADRFGNVFFGFTVSGGNPANLVSGIARINTAGKGTWTSAVSLTGDSAASQIAQNCAPALSNNQTLVYVTTSSQDTLGEGYLASLDAVTLQPVSHIRLFDPRGDPATVSSDSSSAPVIGPDGDVYFGVLESPCCTSHNDRGWLLHFDSALTTNKIPGSFGWDDTPSVVPAAMIPSYTGTSPYLLLTKYNNYADTGGDGDNRLAVLDPFASQPDQYSASQVAVMKEILTVAGVTPDPSLPGVREWCINSAAVDRVTRSAIANNEDGTVYRWDFATNTLSERLSLTSGRGEAYTPTAIGPDGTVFAINDAILFAVGN